MHFCKTNPGNSNEIKEEVKFPNLTTRQTKKAEHGDASGTHNAEFLRNEPNNSMKTKNEDENEPGDVQRTTSYEEQERRTNNDERQNRL